MQVYAPYASFIKNSKRIDSRRANKQILENIQIWAVNNNDFDIIKKWNIIKPIRSGVKNRFQLYKRIKNHPNTKLWKNDSDYLVIYTWALLEEFHERQKKKPPEKRKVHKAQFILDNYMYYQGNYSEDTNRPLHLTSEFCKQHQKLLLEKDYEYYSKVFGEEV